MRKLTWALVCTVFLGVAAAAQGQSALERSFLGKEVEVKIDLPGTQKGVDITAATGQLDWKSYSQRLKGFGIAIRKGDTPTVTAVVVKKDHIEFQLDGGGYGTFWDDTGGVTAQMIPPSSYERQLEDELRRETDPRRRDRLRWDLDRERARRQREQQMENSRAQIANQMKQREIMDRRQQGGSRFNLWWSGRIPPDQLTPEALMKNLSQWVDFGALDRSRAIFAKDAAPASSSPSGDVTRLERGMKMSEVEALLGKGDPIASDKGSDGLRTSIVRYTTQDDRIDVTYVEGVVVRYSIDSR